MDIPGFFYDTDKKKYFKILSSTNAPTTHFVTKQTVKNVLQKKKLNLSNQNHPNNEILHLLNKRLIGECKNPSFKRAINNEIWKRSKWINCQLWDKPIGCQCLGERIRSIVISSTGLIAAVVEKLFAFNTFLFIQVFSNAFFSEPLFKNLKSICNSKLCLDNLFEKEIICTEVTDMQWKNDDLFVLLTIYTNLSDIFTVIFKLQAGEGENPVPKRVYCSPLHSASFSINSMETIGIAHKKQLKLIDKVGQKIHKFKTKNYCAHDFFKQNQSLITIGQNHLPIKINDVRCLQEALTFSNESKLSCHLHVLNNDIHLISAHYNGKILLWDIRNKKVVRNYSEHKNENNRIRLVLDSNEEYFASVDTEGYTRIWDVDKGTIQQTMLPPLPCRPDFTKHSILSFHPFLPKLFFASNDKFFCSDFIE